jgi:hypothetical protein
MVLNFFEKNDENIGVFYSNLWYLAQTMIIKLVFKKNAKFVAENWRQSPQNNYNNNDPVNSKALQNKKKTSYLLKV